MARTRRLDRKWPIFPDEDRCRRRRLVPDIVADLHGDGALSLALCERKLDRGGGRQPGGIFLVVAHAGAEFAVEVERSPDFHFDRIGVERQTEKDP